MMNLSLLLCRRALRYRRAAVAVFLIFALSQYILAQQSNFTRAHAEGVLKVIKDDIKKNYYDPEFHGIDIEARFNAAREKLKTTDNAGQFMAIIAQTLLDFDDSHLFFVPPGRSNRTDYGWEMQSIGDGIYISAVKPGSDAEAKGLKQGDKVLSVNGLQPTRDNLWKIDYLFKALRPQPGLKLAVQSPDGKQQEVVAMAKIKQGKQIMNLTDTIDANEYRRQAEDEDHLDRSRYVEVGDDLLIWKLPTFAVDPASIDFMMGRVRKHKALVLDLRGNGGGYVETCQVLVGAFLDKEIQIAETKGRKETKPMKSKHAGNPYTGKLIVLVDSRSASASEIFARTIQLQKRGVIAGDRSAGAVMRAIHYPHQLGLDTIIPYGVSVTDADLIMPDGKSLEKTGVIPDEPVLPTAADLAARRDPVLTRAAALAGIKIDPEKAGAMFPIEWRK